MRITKDGEVHVSVPWGVPRLVVERFIDDHREWIEQARLRTLQRQQQRDSFYARLPLTTRAQKQEAARRLLTLVGPMIDRYAPVMGVRPEVVTCKFQNDANLYGALQCYWERVNASKTASMS